MDMKVDYEARKKNPFAKVIGFIRRKPKKPAPPKREKDEKRQWFLFDLLDQATIRKTHAYTKSEARAIFKRTCPDHCHNGRLSQLVVVRSVP